MSGDGLRVGVIGVGWAGQQHLAAYDALRPLSEAERAALPVLCRGAALRFLLTRLHDWTETPAGALVTRKDPLEYLRKLRFFTRAEGGADIGL